MQEIYAQEGGYSLVELLIYLGIFVFIGGMAISSYFGVSQAYAQYQANRDINNAAVTVGQYFMREIRHAAFIDGESEFGTSTGRIVLDTTDDADDTAETEIYLSGGRVFAFDGDTEQRITLTSEDVRVTELIFFDATAGSASGVRMKMTLAKKAFGSPTTTEEFITTAALRN